MFASRWLRGGRAHAHTSRTRARPRMDAHRADAHEYASISYRPQPWSSRTTTTTTPSRPSASTLWRCARPAGRAGGQVDRVGQGRFLCKELAFLGPDSPARPPRTPARPAAHLLAGMPASQPPTTQPVDRPRAVPASRHRLDVSSRSASLHGVVADRAPSQPQPHRCRCPISVQGHRARSLSAGAGSHGSH